MDTCPCPGRDSAAPRECHVPIKRGKKGNTGKETKLGLGWIWYRYGMKEKERKICTQKKEKKQFNPTKMKERQVNSTETRLRGE